MPDWLQKILDQWAAVMAAPIPFVTATIAVAIGAWFVLGEIYSTRLANKDAEITLLTRQRDDYRDKVGFLTPDEVKTKIDTLERTVQIVAGSKWEPLSSSEIDRLAANLSAIDPKFLNILYENYLGQDLAQSIFEAFKKAKWPDAFVSQGLGYGPGLKVGSGTGIALKIKNAIESATKLQPTLLYPNEEDRPGLNYFLSVGVNHN